MTTVRSHFTPPITPRLSDADAERIRRAHEEKIVELQRMAAAGLRVLNDVQLADSVITPIAHKLGRPTHLIILSPPRNATSTGRIIEVRNTSFDRSSVIALQAVGWGATITLDIGVL